MTCLSDVSKIVAEQKPDIIEGVRLLADVMEDNNESEGLLFINYDRDPLTGIIVSDLMMTADDELMSLIIVSMMSRDKQFKNVILKATEMFKNLANG